ncbi:LuxR family transcriptional regulator [Mesorhizobium sp. NBSH29]|uniref:LuxR family transcriptional regulator n=1 Tax=Mesorhizobium sp. NBSH29 TaxID=2654249 RepID=UPI001896828A|nr:LuxR family transcriptional regulator [Mesorhizobium sp. NBSH29]QPC88098.1 LuxR family transcriptional regulator [Mesorhizobium sp. NBSH29]
MMESIDTIRDCFAGQETLDACVDQAFSLLGALGFEGLVYDYTPVPFDLDGSIMVPSLLTSRNMADDMNEYWCERGYGRIDPIQKAAARTSVPFFWKFDKSADTQIREFLTEDSEPVVHYMRQRDRTNGVTIPIHLPGGGYATLNGIGFRREVEFARDARHMADFGFLAHIFHECAFEHFDQSALRPNVTPLTERERECLRFSSHGLSAKEISRIIDRSVPTVVMHLAAATRKLGAKNRTQAVVRATHYRMLDG